MPRATSPKESILSIVLLSGTVTAESYLDFNFLDGSINYFGNIIKQSFEYTLIDNVGSGSIRICYNKPEYNISSSVIGSKTLRSLDSLYVDEPIWHVRIYGIENSTVELICKSTVDQNE